jgi:hypothetical protein
MSIAVIDQGIDPLEMTPRFKLSLAVLHGPLSRTSILQKSVESRLHISPTDASPYHQRINARDTR